jgi:osmotically-inducible protein OsmY
MIKQAAAQETEDNTAREVARQIQSRLGRRIRGLKVVMLEHGLVLRGQVPTYYTKQLAQQAAMELGLAVLNNDIQVS